MAFHPGAHAVPASWNYVSTFDMHKPDIDPKLTQAFGNEYLTQLLGMLGKKVGTSSKEYSHYEAERIMPKVNATITGAAQGAESLFTIANTATAQNISIDIASPYIGTTSPMTKQGLPIRLNDIILIKPATGTISAATYIRAIVTEVTKSGGSYGTFKATPIDTNDTIAANAVASDIVILGNAFGEGTSQPESMNTRVRKYTNNVQIIKDSFNITGSENNMILWFDVVDEQTGKSSPRWRLKGESDTYKRFLNKIEMEMILGEHLTNLVVADANLANPISMTEGLIPFILGGGTTSNYGGLAWSLSDGEVFVKQLDKAKGSKDNLLMAGISLSMDIDREFRNTFQNGAVNYGSSSMTEDMKVNLQFSEFKIAEYKFAKKTYSVFNDLQTLGATGYTFDTEAMVIPLDKQMDAKSKEMIDSIRVRYSIAPDGSNSREIMHTAKNMFEVTGSDNFECRYLTEQGFEGFAPNRFGYWKKA